VVDKRRRASLTGLVGCAQGNNASPHTLTHDEGDEASVPPSASAPSSLQSAWSPDNYLSPSPSAVNLQGWPILLDEPFEFSWAEFATGWELTHRRTGTDRR